MSQRFKSRKKILRKYWKLIRRLVDIGDLVAAAAAASIDMICSVLMIYQEKCTKVKQQMGYISITYNSKYVASLIGCEHKDIEIYSLKEYKCYLKQVLAFYAFRAAPFPFFSYKNRYNSQFPVIPPLPPGFLSVVLGFRHVRFPAQGTPGRFHVQGTPVRFPAQGTPGQFPAQEPSRRSPKQGTLGRFPVQETPGRFPAQGTLGRFHVQGTPGRFPAQGTLGRFHVLGTPGRFPAQGTLGRFHVQGTPGRFPAQGTLGRFHVQGTPGCFPAQGTLGRFHVQGTPGRFPAQGTLGRFHVLGAPRRFLAEEHKRDFMYKDSQTISCTRTQGRFHVQGHKVDFMYQDTRTISCSRTQGRFHVQGHKDDFMCKEQYFQFRFAFEHQYFLIFLRLSVSELLFQAYQQVSSLHSLEKSILDVKDLPEPLIRRRKPDEIHVSFFCVVRHITWRRLRNAEVASCYFLRTLDIGSPDFVLWGMSRLSQKGAKLDMRDEPEAKLRCLSKCYAVHLGVSDTCPEQFGIKAFHRYFAVMTRSNNGHYTY
ncbi:hypothetical protein F4703DRAFT_1788779 [Phycomyces blakesleeanus]